MIRIIEGDITRLEVDAIVNAANPALLGGGGVDGAIHRAAGPGLLQACRAIAEVAPGVRCPTGEARITPGFRLPARHVIHTVGPVWRGGGHGEPERLAACHCNCLELAHAASLRCVAFPAISCGVYGYPLQQAAEVCVTTLRTWLLQQQTPWDVILCAFSSETAQAWRRALAANALADCGKTRT
jgi:O-acetyl-ADP-ribose deacetylase